MMPRLARRTTLLLGLLGSLLSVTPASALTALVVDDTSIDSTQEDRVISAKLVVYNTSDSTQSVDSAVRVGSACTVRVTDKSNLVLGSQKATINLTIAPGCFPVGTSEILVNLSYAAEKTSSTIDHLPTITIARPDDALELSGLVPLYVGIAAGIFGGLLVLRSGRRSHDNVQDSMYSPADRQMKIDAYRAVQDLVEKRWLELNGSQQLVWKPLDKLATYRRSDTVEKLDAGWSLKDSWATSLTISTAALVALLTSTDALKLVLTDVPKAALGVALVSGLLSALVVAVASTLVRLIGPSPKVVTVKGLIGSSALIAGAALMQTITVGGTAFTVLWADHSWPAVGVGIATAFVAAVLYRYFCETLGSTIKEGQPTRFPDITPGDVRSWRARTASEEEIVRRRIRITYAAWLMEMEDTSDVDGYPPLGPWSYPTSPGDTYPTSPGDSPGWWTPSPYGRKASLP